MTQSTTLRAFCRSDVGKVRSVNEDAVYISPDSRLILVLDGVGGSSSGEIASSIAKKEIQNWYENTEENVTIDPTMMREILGSANTSIKEQIKTNPELAGMATTACLAYIDDTSFATPRIHICHVGDSRAYIRRKNALIPLTLDDSWHNGEVQAGNRPLAEMSKLKKNSITQSLGSLKSTEQISYSYITLYDEDIILLTTDGIHDYIDHSTLNAFLGSSQEGTDSESDQDSNESSASGIVDNIIGLANEKGGEDNATIALVYVGISGGSETNLLVKQNKENWILGKANGELVYTHRIVDKDDSRLVSFVRIATPEGESFLIKDSDKLSAILSPPPVVEATPSSSNASEPGPSSDVPAKGAHGTPEVEKIKPLAESFSRKKTSPLEYLVGAFALLLIVALAVFYFTDNPLGSTDEELAPKKKGNVATSVVSPPPHQPIHLVSKGDLSTPTAIVEDNPAPEQEPAKEEKLEVAKDAEAEKTQEPQVTGDHKQNEEVRQAEIKKQVEKTDPVEESEETEVQQLPEAKAQAGTEVQPPENSESPSHVDQAELPALDMQELAKRNRALVNLVQSSTKYQKNRSIERQKTDTKAFLEAHMDRLTSAGDQADLLQKLALNYLSAQILRPETYTETDRNFDQKLIEATGKHFANNTYAQATLAIAEDKLLGNRQAAMARLEAAENTPSQYIYDNLTLASFYVKENNGQKSVETTAKVMTAISPLLTHDLNYMRLHSPGQGIAYVAQFKKLYDYSDAYQYIKKALPPAQAKFVRCKLEFLELRYTKSCLNQVDTIISNKALDALTKDGDSKTLNNIYYLRYLLSRKRFAQAKRTIELIEKNKKTNKFDGYLAFAHAALAENIEKEKSKMTELLKEGRQLDPNFKPLTQAIANNSTSPYTF